MPGSRKTKQSSHQKIADVQQSGSLPAELKGKWQELNLGAQILDSATDSINVLDLEGNIVYINERTCKSLGYSRDELMGMNIRHIVSPEFIPLIGSRMKEILEKDEATFETAHIRKDGSTVPLELHARIIEYGGRKLILDVGRDITERKKLEEELKLRADILDSATDLIFLRDLNGNFVYVNEMATEALGYSKEEILSMNIQQLLVPDEAKQVESRTQELLKRGKFVFESSQVRKDGSIIPMEVHATGIEFGGKQFVLAVCRDITRRKEAEEELTLKSQLLDGATDIIYLRDIEGKYLYMNETASKHLGYTREELLTMTIQQLVPHGYPTATGLLQPELDSKGKAVFETYLTRKDGSLMPVEVHAQLIEVGGRKLISDIARDITERKKMEEVIKQLAYHDTLTGLPNRTLFTDRFNLALAHAIRYQHKLAVLMMDLDKFKEINDTLGHDAGDDLLKDVGSRLSALVRKTDTVSRRGGDEFVLLLTEVHQVEDATNVAQKIIEAILKPFVLRGRRRSVTTSVGIAIYPDDGQDIDTLLKHADDAMYQVKHQGRNGYLRYSPSL